MTIRTIRTRVISMTIEEHQAFMEAMEVARVGQTVHSASVPLKDGSFLGVKIMSEEQVREQEKQEEVARDLRRQEQREQRKW